MTTIDPGPTTDGATATGLPQPHELTADEFALMMNSPATGSTAGGSTAAAPAPTMAPPQAGTSASASLSGQLIDALWAEQSNRNSWAHLQTAGWKKLSPVSDTGSTAMALLAAHARAVGSAPYADENPAGTLADLYVW